MNSNENQKKNYICIFTNQTKKMKKKNEKEKETVINKETHNQRICQSRERGGGEGRGGGGGRGGDERHVDVRLPLS